MVFLRYSIRIAVLHCKGLRYSTMVYAYAYHCHPYPFKIQPILDVFEALFCVAEIQNGSSWALILSTKQLTPQFFVGRKTAHALQGLVFIMKLRITKPSFWSEIGFGIQVEKR